MAPNDQGGDSTTASVGQSNEPAINVYTEVSLKTLPTFSQLNEKVQKVVRSSSWWDKYGVDWMHILMVTSTVPFALSLLKRGGIAGTILATFLLGAFHSIITNKGGHVAAHGSLVASKRLKNFWSMFTVEFMGCYSWFMANYIHIDIHHPYTNIIGLGDSSSWKAPFLGRTSYLFFAPLLLPIITPVVSIQQLIELKRFKELLQFFMVTAAGLTCHVFVLAQFADFSNIGAIVYLLVYRAAFAIPYIHVNIFQHIGLPMYSPKAKPVRIYQMSTGVLNLSRNIILDYIFGHSLINCHVEHHLFPKLSDNMCLKVKPIVRGYLKEHGLPYQEDTYVNRLMDFYNRYDVLMVKAPPITHFVGLP